MDELDELNNNIDMILGWTYDGKNWRGPGGSVWEEHKDYARDIAAAWELVDKVKSDKWFASIDRDHTRWLCFFGSNISSEDEYYQGEGKTAPEAICRAWLAWKKAQE